MASTRLQLSLAILKPDLLTRPLATQMVRNIILNEGFYVVRSSVMRLRTEAAERFYSEHQGKFFFGRLVSYMSSGPINPMVLAHKDAIQKWRALMGPTKSYVAQATAPHTIRGMYGLTDTRNATHGSDSSASAEREIAFFFPDFDAAHWYQDEEPSYRNGTVSYCEKEQRHKPVFNGSRLESIYSWPAIKSTVQQ